MMWLTWRQFRPQAIAGITILAVFAIILGVTGPHLAHLYDTSGLPGCRAHGDCAAQASSFLSTLNSDGVYPLLYLVSVVVVLLAPAIIGIFWGAPLIASELEAGTFQLAWNQSVTRARWLAAKLGLVGLASMAAAGLLSLMLSWWAAPIVHAAQVSGGSGSKLSMNEFAALIFASRGITPVGYAAFAFALGVTAGVVLRRTVSAMAVTLAGFAVVQFVMPLWIRPRLIPPVHTVAALSSVSLGGLGMTSNGSMILSVNGINGTDSWVLSSQPVTAAGQPYLRVPAACKQNLARYEGCLAQHGVHAAVSYQPAGRYWDFQWLEFGIFVALALVLAGFCAWRISSRRLS
jgi:ABC-type transport system involved in multi-copper enzyme maturation permease subunit